MPRVLFVAAHRLNRAPSQRFRFEQYLDYLRSEGIDCTISPLLSADDDRLFYGKASAFSKAWVLARGAVLRTRDVRRAAQFDTVFVQREAFFGGWPVFEKAFKRTGTPLVLDFDDAIWLLDVSDANRRYGWLKRPQKTAEIARLADLVIAGNSYLLDYARAQNPSVTLIPTTIDTESYRRSAPAARTDDLCIGWTGSTTTIKHFHQSVPALVQLKAQWGHRLRFRVIGDGSYRNETLGIVGEPWDPGTEIESLCGMDIGIMPLPDDEWSRGKCGLKGLQFMALEIPVVMENVGANKEIVTDGRDGFLASGNDEWVSKLSSLVASAEMRQRMGLAGRATVEARFSVNSQKGAYVQALRNVFGKRRSP
ncbi:MAG: glycosyltransferase family 4 protein [Fimbriimonadaceae bacterium]|nr:glycosyltransferase family 4 protein [Fimbriimonadaceae bacterium]